MVPVFVPFTVMLTPASGLPALLTVPVMLLCWARPVNARSNMGSSICSVLIAEILNG